MRLVIKTGSAILSKQSGGLDSAALHRIASQIHTLFSQGHEIVLVSSGAIAAGVSKLAWTERPTDLRLKQAAAAVGQLALMKAYEEAFSKYEMTPAQILLTRDDLDDRQRYLNARNTLLHLLSLRIIPIINENDSVSTEEIQFGDNDTLAAAVATKVHADKLILLSDVPGVFETSADGQLTTTLIPEIEKVTAEMEKKALKSKGSKMSVGGIVTKLRAARMATAVGIETWVASGYDDRSLIKIINNEPEAGTKFKASASKRESREAWIAFGRQPKGSLHIDEGALKALVDQNKSLLPAGIKKVSGTFQVGDAVQLKSAKGHELGRGLVNFSSLEIKKIKGHHSRDISQLLGRDASAEVVHRDNLVLL
jgi:glutamate 5-kinase